MGNRAWCPACNDETSSILAGFRDQGRCPNCGLSVTAAEELLAARAKGAEFSLVVSAAQAECRAQQAEREAARLWAVLDRVRRVLAEAVVS